MHCLYLLERDSVYGTSVLLRQNNCDDNQLMRVDAADAGGVC